MNLFQNVYSGRRVLITGHTGFKGSWLAFWLHKLGADVTGVALPPSTDHSHWDALKLPITSITADIRDEGAVQRVVEACKPEIIFHLAAQPLVRRSYKDPLETWSTNVIGTANVLDACRNQQSIRAIVVVTTDKCYENREWQWGYREDDKLGGHDPYSASKAATELVAASYRHAFFCQDASPLLATGRAGNVIGGGDWSEDRLIPDLVRSLAARRTLTIRSPEATRPWQHVLESLSGYLLLGQKLLLQEKRAAASWNFGPGLDGNCSVKDVLSRLAAEWPSLAWEKTDQPQPHESQLLYLDSSNARSLLGWRPVWSLSETLMRTADWYRAWFERGEIITDHQLNQYISDANEADLAWATL